jgi:uncharacterized protein (TIGR03435 family)
MDIFTKLSHVITVGFFAASGLAQQADIGFSVASVKRSQPGDQAVLSHYPGARFVAQKATLKILISYAYEINSKQILGGPGWLDSDRFDVEAKAAEGTSPPDDSAEENMRKIRLMLRSLLASRFGVQAKFEDRDSPVYALVVLKTGGAKGLVANDGTKPYTVANHTFSSYRKRGEVRFAFQKVNMHQLASQLSGVVASDDVGRPVVDKTALNGEFDFNLTWVPLANSSMPEANGPGIFTALQEQLGLKLQAGRGLVRMLIVDHAVPPGEN